MGSCTSRAEAKVVRKITNTNPNTKIAEEVKRPARTPILQTRKNLKQKGAVVDNRLQNNETTDLAGISPLNKKKTSEDLKLIDSSLKSHFIFNSLTDQQKKIIIERMVFYSIGSNQLIFEQNSKGSGFYVIASGRVEVVINAKRVNVLKTGDSFGELALLHDTPRTATVVSMVKTSLWSLDRGTFRNTIEELNSNNYKENKSFIDSIPVFESLSEGQRESLVSCLSLLKFSIGSKIVSEGDPGDLLYIIKEGNVVFTLQGKEIGRMSKGDYFGEQALYHGTTRSATVLASDDVTCVALGREDLISCLGADLQLIIYKNSMRIAFKQSPKLSKLDRTQIEKIINKMQLQSFEPGQEVVKAGIKSRAFCYL